MYAIISRARGQKTSMPWSKTAFVLSASFILQGDASIPKGLAQRTEHNLPTAACPSARNTPCQLALSPAHDAHMILPRLLRNPTAWRKVPSPKYFSS